MLIPPLPVQRLRQPEQVLPPVYPGFVVYTVGVFGNRADRRRQIIHERNKFVVFVWFVVKFLK